MSSFKLGGLASHLGSHHVGSHLGWRRGVKWRWPLVMGALLTASLAIGCETPSKATPSSSGVVASGDPLGKPPGVEVIPSGAAKITEEDFNAALDRQLAAIANELTTKSFRSRMHIAAELGQRMQPQRIVNEVSKSMGVSDVSVLSLFAKNPNVRASVGARVKAYADSTSEKLMAANTKLPMVVKDDCRDAAARRLLLVEVGAGKRQASAGDRQAAPLVAAVMKECQTAADSIPELACYIDAKDDAALKACP